MSSNNSIPAGVAKSGPTRQILIKKEGELGV